MSKTKVVIKNMELAEIADKIENVMFVRGLNRATTISIVELREVIKKASDNLSQTLEIKKDDDIIRFEAELRKIVSGFESKNKAEFDLHRQRGGQGIPQSLQQNWEKELRKLRENHSEASKKIDEHDIFVRAKMDEEVELTGFTFIHDITGLSPKEVSDLGKFIILR
ncbi:MAG: hypothetical protein JXR36_04140 [Bacteroidales bacterium]|nr:hypothetical protein [Bacteroidales bacterium]